MMYGARERKYDPIKIVGGVKADKARRRLRRIRRATITRETTEER